MNLNTISIQNHLNQIDILLEDGTNFSFSKTEQENIICQRCLNECDNFFYILDHLSCDAKFDTLQIINENNYNSLTNNTPIAGTISDFNEVENNSLLLNENYQFIDFGVLEAIDLHPGHTRSLSISNQGYNSTNISESDIFKDLAPTYTNSNTAKTPKLKRTPVGMNEQEKLSIMRIIDSVYNDGKDNSFFLNHIMRLPKEFADSQYSWSQIMQKTFSRNRNNLVKWRRLGELLQLHGFIEYDQKCRAIRKFETFPVKEEIIEKPNPILMKRIEKIKQLFKRGRTGKLFDERCDPQPFSAVEKLNFVRGLNSFKGGNRFKNIEKCTELGFYGLFGKVRTNVNLKDLYRTLVNNKSLLFDADSNQYYLKNASLDECKGLSAATMISNSIKSKISETKFNKRIPEMNTYKHRRKSF